MVGVPFFVNKDIIMDFKPSELVIVVIIDAFILLPALSVPFLSLFQGRYFHKF